jgi:glucose-1-phosphate thymidylyltransferase
MVRKGIVLAGGAGTRLYPMTRGVSKQLLPVYNKPLVYYPLSVLMLAEIREVMFISTPEDLPRFEQILGDGSALGMSFRYCEQENPEGVAHAFVVAADFIQDEPSALILGDNIFYGQGLRDKLRDVTKRRDGATVFAYRVTDPERYGVVEVDEIGVPISLAEKPDRPRSNLAMTGLYFVDGTVAQVARSLTPSARGELEIPDLLRSYLDQGNLSVEFLGRGNAWLDTGTFDSLLDASNYIATIERRQGQMVACIEEIAWRNGWIDNQQLRKLAEPLANSGYGDYLLSLAFESS